MQPAERVLHKRAAIIKLPTCPAQPGLLCIEVRKEQVGSKSV